MLGSATLLGSAFWGFHSRPARASTVILEESEARRIEMFERNSPSVVFIDTFTEKQDQFSPNVMEVPLGSGSGFVWDRDGHIGTSKVKRSHAE
jgi:S1-C subfamily serine protease